MLTILLLLLALLTPQPVVRVVTLDKETIAENLLAHPVTLTLTPDKLENVVPSVPLPLTVCLAAHQKLSLVSWRQKSSWLPWRARYKYTCVEGNLRPRHDPDAVYRLPFRGTHRVVQGYHGKFSHRGFDEYALDFGMPEGTPVYAARAGVVVFVETRFKDSGTTDFYRRRANQVRVLQDDGTLAEYLHLRPAGSPLHEGDALQPGDLVGYSGHTGYASGPHLHFAVFGARDGAHKQTFPIRFQLDADHPPRQLQEGQSYTAP